MTEPPHSFHDPVTDFASVVNNPPGSYIFTLPETTSSLGLYGRFWLSPLPPTPNAKLSGIRFINSSWTGTTDDSVVVFSLLDRQTEDNALGTVTGAYQGLANQLVAVLFDMSSEKIELKFHEPVYDIGERFVAVVDAENLPTGNPSVIFPDRILVENIQWLWSE